MQINACLSLIHELRNKRRYSRRSTLRRWVVLAGALMLVVTTAEAHVAGAPASVFPNPRLTNPRMQFNTGTAANGVEQISPYLPDIVGPLSGWVVTMWDRSQVLNAREMVTNDKKLSDPLFGSAAYAFTTPNHKARLAIYRDRTAHCWVYDMFERNGRVNRGGGANLFLAGDGRARGSDMTLKPASCNATSTDPCGRWLLTPGL